MDSGSEYDYYADTLRPAVLTERRSSVLRVLKVAAGVLAGLGIVLIATSYFGWQASGSRYAIVSTQYFLGVVIGAGCLVAAGNAWVWGRWLRRPGGSIVLAISLALLSPLAVFALAVGVYVASSI